MDVTLPLEDDAYWRGGWVDMVDHETCCLVPSLCQPSPTSCSVVVPPIAAVVVLATVVPPVAVTVVSAIVVLAVVVSAIVVSPVAMLPLAVVLLSFTFQQLICT